MVKSEEQRFSEALQAYQDDAKPKYKADVLIQSTHNWSEVLAAVTATQKARSERADFCGRLLKKLRWFGEQSVIFEQWVELLPTQNQYFSVLCGGLKLILGAAAKLRDIRQGICDALEELPTLLSCTNKTLDAFDSVELHTCSRELMAKTFTTLQWVVWELRQSAGKKGMKAFFQQDNYAKSLSSSIADMRKLSDRFKEIAATCGYTKLKNVEKIATSTKNQLGFEHEVTNAMVVQTGQAVAAHISRRLDADKGELKTHLSYLYSQVTSFLDSQLDNRELPLFERVYQARRVVSKPRKQRSQIRAEILDHFQYDNDILEADVLENLSRIWSASRQVHDRVHALISEPKLGAWLTEPSSTILLINGNHAASEHTASTSFVSAKLIESISGTTCFLEASERASICLFFFCADHVRSRIDEYTGPAGMLRALIGQLLSSYEDFHLHRVQKLYQQFDLMNVETLWTVFDSLASQLPKTMALFCILDGLSAYEVSEWHQDTEFVVDHLVRLSRWTKERGDGVIKLLFTSPLSCRSVQHNLNRSEIVEMPARVPATGGLSQKAWAVSRTSRAIEDGRIGS